MICLLVQLFAKPLRTGSGHGSARVLIAAACIFVALSGVASQAQLDPNYVFQSEPVPPDTLRIIALGTGDPLVVRNQVATSYLLQLGGKRNILFDAGTGR